MISLHALCASDCLTLLVGKDVDVGALADLPADVEPRQISDDLPDTLTGNEMILVRPDGHVAWKGRDQDAAGLANALNAILRSDILTTV